MGLSERRNLLLKEQLLYVPPFEAISAAQGCPEGNPLQRRKEIPLLHPPCSFYAPPKPALSKPSTPSVKDNSTFPVTQAKNLRAIHTLLFHPPT